MDKKKQYQYFEEIYRLYSKAIYRFIYFKVSDYELARDLTADTFLRFWKTLSDGEEIRNDRTFLYLIAHGLIIDHYRKKKNINQVSFDKVVDIDERLYVTPDDTENKIDAKEEINRIFLKLKELKDEYRDVLILHYITDLEISEISIILNKKENAVRVLIHRALEHLKKRYE